MINTRLESRDDDDTPVIRHSPDHSAYFYPDGTQASTLGSRSRGAVTVPMGKFDGATTGFNCQRPGIVIVDPTGPGGGVAVDYTKLTQRTVEEAVATSTRMRQVFEKMSAAAVAPDSTVSSQGAVLVNQPAGSPPSLSSSQPVPVATPEPAAPVSQGLPGGPPPLPYPQVYAQLPPQPYPSPQPYPQPPYPYPPAYQQPAFVPMAQDPTVQAILASLEKLGARVDSLAAAPQPAPPALPTVPVVRPMPATETPLPRRLPDAAGTISRDEDAQEGVTMHPATLRAVPVERVAEAFAALAIPFVTGPVAEKPKIQVYFDFGAMGRQGAKFHGAIESKGCVVLVYDNRYEDGSPYMPPELETPITVALPGSRKEYQVMSMGLTFSLGTFDMIVLVVNEAGALA